MKTNLALAAILALACHAAPALAQGSLTGDRPAAKPEMPQPTPAPAPTPAAAPEAPKQEQALQYVTMTTSMGDIVIELNAEKAPLSVANFLTYVDKDFYNGTIFHRVMPNFMIQGGGFTSEMSQKPTGPGVKNEWKNGLKNTRGAIAMARTQIADSGTSQFFINVVDNAMLDQPNDGAAYAVFGKVVSGMEVVDKIRAVPTGNKGMHQNVPTEVVEIKSVKRSEAPASEKK